jgi:hypothetical protein
MLQGNADLVRKLLRLGADPNTQDNAGDYSRELVCITLQCLKYAAICII